jgi:hypothetical protein
MRYEITRVHVQQIAGYGDFKTSRDMEWFALSESNILNGVLLKNIPYDYGTILVKVNGGTIQKYRLDYDLVLNRVVWLDNIKSNLVVGDIVVIDYDYIKMYDDSFVLTTDEILNGIELEFIPESPHTTIELKIITSNSGYDTEKEFVYGIDFIVIVNRLKFLDTISLIEGDEVIVRYDDTLIEVLAEDNIIPTVIAINKFDNLEEFVSL